MIASNAEGEIQAEADTRTVASNTYIFTKSQYTAWKDGAATNLADVTDVTMVQNTSEADPFFNFFYCGGSRDHTYTCYKYMPAVGTDGDARFEAGSSATAVRFITGAAPVEKSLTLTGAVECYSMGLIGLVSAILAISFN